MIVQLIVACEILFWVFLGAGLTARYLLRRPTLGAVLLVGAPLVDVVLLVATTIDLRGGAEASWSHGLAAAYIGFSVAFGHSIIRWADGRFAHRFAGGPAPRSPPGTGGHGRSASGASSERPWWPGVSRAACCSPRSRWSANRTAPQPCPTGSARSRSSSVSGA